jgi:hypothetical protein
MVSFKYSKYSKQASTLKDPNLLKDGNSPRRCFLMAIFSNPISRRARCSVDNNLRADFANIFLPLFFVNVPNYKNNGLV